MTELLTNLGLILIPMRYEQTIATAIGVAILLCATVLLLRKRKWNLGSKYIYIPLIVITVSALFSGCTWADKLISVVLLGVYVLGVNSSEKSTKWLGVAVVVGCVSVAILSLVTKGRSGGMYSPNPNVAIGAITMGTLLWRHKYQWILVTVALVGLVFTGGEEALVVIAIVGLAVLVRKDWSRKLLIPIGITTVAVALCILVGQQIWSTTTARLEGITQNNLDVAINGRLDAYELAISNIKPLGHGYEPLNVSPKSIHNVPLRVLYEVGPVAALAWLWIIGYGLLRSRAKYIFVAILALSLFDHFMWTSLSTYMYFALGASATVTNDLVFRKSQ